MGYELSLDGARVISADLILPHQGRWTADLHADLDQEPTIGSSATLRLLGRDYLGVIAAAGEIGGVWQLRLVGGKGGLDKIAQAKHYRHGPTVGLVARDLLSEIGEQLAPTSDSGVLSSSLTKWTRTKAPAIDLLGSLTDQAGAIWRTLADGLIWIGKDLWTPVLVEDWTLIGGSLEAGRLVIGAERLTLDPGQELDGLRVRSLRHLVLPGSSRTTLVLDQEPHPLCRMVDRWMRRRGYDYARPQAGKAVSQDADGTLQIQLDATDHPTLTGVPIRPGLPHTAIKILPGARVLVEWEGGVPGAPVVTAWGDSSAQEIQIGGAGARAVARDQDRVDGGYLVATPGAMGITAIAWLPPGSPIPPPPAITIPMAAMKIVQGSSILKAGG